MKHELALGSGWGIMHFYGNALLGSMGRVIADPSALPCRCIARCSNLGAAPPESMAFLPNASAYASKAQCCTPMHSLSMQSQTCCHHCISSILKACCLPFHLQQCCLGKMSSFAMPPLHVDCLQGPLSSSVALCSKVRSHHRRSCAQGADLPPSPGQLLHRHQLQAALASARLLPSGSPGCLAAFPPPHLCPLGQPAAGKAVPCLLQDGKTL